MNISTVLLDTTEIGDTDPGLKAEIQKQSAKMMKGAIKIATEIVTDLAPKTNDPIEELEINFQLLAGKLSKREIKTFRRAVISSQVNGDPAISSHQVKTILTKSASRASSLAEYFREPSATR